MVYTDFVVSFDGRIATVRPETGDSQVPPELANPHDWRLYQELAACADVLIVSARYIRQLSCNTAQSPLPISDAPPFTDLEEWRLMRGLSPQPDVVILSTGMDLPLPEIRAVSDRNVYVATGDATYPAAVDLLRDTGVQVLCAGEGACVDGGRLVELLATCGYDNIYSIAGPGVLQTLLQAGVLNRIYLTHVHRLVGGQAFDTLLQSDPLAPPVDVSLRALFYDINAGKDIRQCFGVYDVDYSRRR